MCDQRIFEQPELGSISDLDFGVAAGMKRGTFVPGLDKKGGLEGGGIHPLFLYLFRSRETLQTWL